MPCYFPMQAFRGKDVTKNGKRKVVFNYHSAFNPELEHNRLTLPCGQCVGCRLERSRQWAVRCVHETEMHEENCFITLTFNDKYLKEMCPDMSLNVRHFQLFMKRLRFRFGEGIRFFHCGEYGAKYGRPHYHALLFNFNFPDLVLWKDSKDARFKLYRSKILEELWPYGYSSVGTATFESAAYVARYIMKKVTGDDAVEHYKAVDIETGELFDRKPEYTTMSRRPGIGKEWYDLFNRDVYPRDEVVVRAKKMKPPRYYDSLYELYDPEDMERIKIRRKMNAKKHADDSTPERLEVRRKCKERQIESLVRNVDKEI